MVVPVRAPLILFDGVCNLCNAWVRFVIRHDPTGVFRFAAQQSPVGQAVIEGHVRGTGQLSSIVLIADGWVYTESDAIFQIFCAPRYAVVMGRVIADHSWSSCDTCYHLSSAIGTEGSGKLKPARCRRRTRGRDSSDDLRQSP